MLKCHCRDCQQMSGGPYTPVVYVLAKAFRITKGALRHHSTPSVNSGHNLRGFCAECGSPLFSEPPGDTIRVVKAGSLDDPSWLKIGGALYTASAQPWAHIDETKMRFEKMPPGAP